MGKYCILPAAGADNAYTNSNRQNCISCCNFISKRQPKTIKTSY